MKIYTEKEVMEKTGYSKQTLRNLRNGRKGKYDYPAQLEYGLHWRKFSGAVAFTVEGLEAIMLRAKKMKKTV